MKKNNEFQVVLLIKLLIPSDQTKILESNVLVIVTVYVYLMQLSSQKPKIIKEKLFSQILDLTTIFS